MSTQVGENSFSTAGGRFAKWRNDFAIDQWEISASYSD